VTRIVFTLNNYTPEEYTWFTETFAPTAKWGIIGKETGANGTQHLQGACGLASRMAFSKLKTLFGFKRSHIECMRGKPEDSKVYCSKEDPNPFLFGDWPQPGKRSDIRAAVLRVQNGDTMRDMARDEDGGVAVVKFHKGLTILRSLTRPMRNSAPFICWFWGPTGTGKTRCAWELAGGLLERRGYAEDDIWTNSNDLSWFDGYDGQGCAIIDDFRNKHVKSFAFFLKLLDRYALVVPFKGGFVNWGPSIILITCPYNPDRCFSKRAEHVPEDIAQLLRRIKESGGGVFEFEDENSREDIMDSVRELYSSRFQLDGNGTTTCSGQGADNNDMSGDDVGGGLDEYQQRSQPGVPLDGCVSLVRHGTL